MSGIKHVKAFYGIEPILETKIERGRTFGLHRDRDSDSGWGEWRWSVMEHGNRLELVPIEGKMKKILLEDLAKCYSDSELSRKVQEFFPGFLNGKSMES